MSVETHLLRILNDCDVIAPNNYGDEPCQFNMVLN